MDPKSIVAKNLFSSLEYDENSFAGILHEQSIWQWEKYWLLEWALYRLAAEGTNDADMCLGVFQIFSGVLNAICSHLDRDDLFQIKNLDHEIIYDLRERILMVFEGFFQTDAGSIRVFR
ncbi:Imm41 family immunity protein [Trinickia fusca]|uniref:Uncharacterized protein n=1 Tax=Trinickia fusca TaxID=2419777 RepID=A0A494X5L5_9BURK|nr:Imm41 family immunity protein [Trinickia fusca]RKP43279.1 hypothetical protein D7S89_26850 [Trinickia fusca]